RLDAHVVATVAAVDFDDALHIGLHHRARQRAARLGLDFLVELLVLDALVALELDAADDGILDHRDDHTVALECRAHVGKQTGRVERLDALVDLQRIEPLTGADAEVGANRIAFDAAIAFHNDGGRGLRHDGIRRHEERKTTPDNYPA